MRVLGIDPGIAVTGYAIVERTARGRLEAVDIGVLRTPADHDPASRLLVLHEAVAAVIDRHRPQAVAVERLFFNINVRTAIAVAQASGVILAAAARSGLTVSDYTPPDVKLSVAGFGGAGKKQVQAMVARCLGLAAPPSPPDAADAAALAICHLNRSGLRRAIAAAGAPT